MQTPSNSDKRGMMSRAGGRTLWELSSDFFREAAVLVLVFGFLDKSVRGESIGVYYGLDVLGISFVLFAFGIILERRRKDG